MRKAKFGLVLLASIGISASIAFGVSSLIRLRTFSGANVAAAAGVDNGNSGVPTLSAVDQVSSSPSTAQEFAVMIRAGQLRNPVEGPESLRIADGSMFSGTLLRRADGDDGYTCIRALDGMACGQLSDTQRVISGMLQHPDSGLPTLVYGAVGAGVTSVTVECLNGTYPATLVQATAFTATLPADDPGTSCHVQVR